MGLNPPVRGLRVFVNASHSVAKVDLRVPAGAGVAVDEETAAQLPASFKPADNAVISETESEVTAPRKRRPRSDA